MSGHLYLSSLFRFCLIQMGFYGHSSCILARRPRSLLACLPVRQRRRLSVEQSCPSGSQEWTYSTLSTAWIIVRRETEKQREGERGYERMKDVVCVFRFNNDRDLHAHCVGRITVTVSETSSPCSLLTAAKTLASSITLLVRVL